MDILIIDDDPIVGDLSQQALREAGFETELLPDGKHAIETIRERRPRLVVLDIMMPGLDGISLCKAIKSEPDTADAKVVLVSGKAFGVERQRALSVGAVGFIEKPYTIEEFPRRIQAYLDGHVDADPEPAQARLQTRPEDAASTVSVSFWGARGLNHLIPNRVSRYGFQTAAVVVETPHNAIVLDGGSGAVAAGKDLMSRRADLKEIWMLLTHFKIEHILGMAMFPPLHDPDYTLHVGGANDPEKSLAELVQQVCFGSFSSVAEKPQAKVDTYEFEEGAYELAPGFKLSTMYANHPTTTLAYKLEIGDKRLVYAPASELFGVSATALNDYDEKLALFAQEADLLIHDGYFTPEDAPEHARQGRSNYVNTLELAGERANVRRLVLMELNPDYDDERLDAIENDCRAMVEENSWGFEVELAKEGLRFEL